MSSGLLGKSDLTASTNTTVYTVPALTVATVNVAFVNRTTSPVQVRLAVANLDTPTNSEYLEYNVYIGAQGVLERTAIVCGAGEKIVCWALESGVNVRVFGFEE